MTSRSGRTRGGMLEAVALAVLVGGCTGVPAASDPSHVSGAPLIPVTTFFANRESNYDYKVSPDGRRLAWMASAGGRLTVHFRELDGGEVGVIDLLDAVDWAVRRGVADRRREGIMGWSYGGYATLVGMTFTPDVFACGVDIVGPSNLVSMLETRHTYWTWHALRPYWHKYAGDPARAEDRPRMEAKSPLFGADRVQRPLLIVHGANDPNVKLQESDQMVEALRRAGKEVEYLVFADEGHGGFDWRNNVKLFEAVERFLARHLGGRVAAPELSSTLGRGSQRYRLPSVRENVPTARSV